MTRIFFCPVGMTDPMSVYKNDITGDFDAYDASMMHIYRKYLPDFTYLYMTDRIFIIEQADGRYTRSMKLLAELNEKSFKEGEDYGIIHSQAADPVFDMDAFYDEFLSVLTEIAKKHGADAEIIVNMSSGTPAMKSALFVLQSMKNLNVKLVQALDPEPLKKTMPFKSYPLENCWTMNRDNQLTTHPEDTTRKFRIHEVTNRHLNAMKINSIMKELVDSYEYDAAKRLFSSFFAQDGDTLSDESKKLLDFLTFAENRVMLRVANLKDDKNHSYEQFKKDYIPGYPDKSVFITLEYANRFKLYFDCKDYTGAARAMTPLDTKLLSKVLEKKIGVDPMSCTEKNGCLKKSDKLPEEFKRVYMKTFNGNIKSDLLTPITMSKMIQTATGNARNDDLCQKVRRLSEIEKNVRNVVAHTLASYSETGFLEEAQLRDVDELFGLYEAVWAHAGFGEVELRWDLYATMNEGIKRMIDEVL